MSLASMSAAVAVPEVVGTRSTFESPIAAFVASMLREMNGSSRVLTLGCTTNLCTIAGYTAPATMATTTQRPTARAGSRQPFCRMFQRSKIATATDTKIMRLMAGSCALMSVYKAPSTTLRDERVRL